ncbi:hypothetical protein O181_022285 [Austropuccinia psidii MF-1]|uniref:Glycoside hydrolase family 92 protein n=1 Tax=Austropuccinia psidii MF-1 TaxID=1389203 RepID=A0A9Q3CG78_9BASI|nr:hypothetical protein [Austropuccinia psidii MF-1]
MSVNFLPSSSYFVQSRRAITTLAKISFGLILSHSYLLHPSQCQGENSSSSALTSTRLPPSVAHNSDLTKYVRPLIGTANDGNVCPGASVPFGMVKVNPDIQGYAPPGYNSNVSEPIKGFSMMHDSGTGSTASYGNFEIMPVSCPQGFDSCPTWSTRRTKQRVPGSDVASPGYFSTTLQLANSKTTKFEATSTRRAAIEKFSFSDPEAQPYFVLDLAQDQPNSFQGGNLTIDPLKGLIKMGGKWYSSFGPRQVPYQAFACYDVTNRGQNRLHEFGVWKSNKFNDAEKGLGITQFVSPANLLNSADYQSGALVGYPKGTTNVTIRGGISFVSVEQACLNMEEEIGGASFEQVHQRSVDLWNEKLNRLEIPLNETDKDITILLYTSMYRSFLTPNNATGETQGFYAHTKAPYFDSLYCSWDTFRTVYPWLHLHSPVEAAEIVENYIDGWRQEGFLPECRANNIAGFTQGGSSGTNILADFALKYGDVSAKLGVNLGDMYQALVNDAETTPQQWDFGGRQISVYKKYGYLARGALDTSSTGRETREASRTLEYAFNDFAISRVSQLLGHVEDATTYQNRSLWYRNVWNPQAVADGFKGFTQNRFPNGTFNWTDPKTCSPKDENPPPCSLQFENIYGFYESSAWEYSFFAPHDTNYLIKLMGGIETFLKRLDHFFDQGYYLAGNEPSFQTPIQYHYAGKPARSVDRVREIVRSNFNTELSGIPGNDDQAAMATLLIFHLLGLYPVPSTTQYLILSPWVARYTIHNPFLGISTTVKTTHFSKASLKHPIPAGTPAYVREVQWNGKKLASRCFLDFRQVFRVGGELEIILTADKNEAEGCDGPLPDSVSTGGFRYSGLRS